MADYLEVGVWPLCTYQGDTASRGQYCNGGNVSAGSIDGDKFGFLQTMLGRGVRHISIWDASGEMGNVSNCTDAEWFKEEWWVAIGKFLAVQ
jgi:hypothetical protein